MLSWKKLLLVRSDILLLFVNTLNANEKYLHEKSENFSQQIQMQLSQNPKTFSRFYITFLISISNPDQFEKGINLIA